LEYASTLQSHQTMWHLAASYLAECREYGEHYLRQLIRSRTIPSDQVAHKLVSVCDKFGLLEDKLAIYNNMGMQAIRKAGTGRVSYGSSVFWFSKAGNTRRLAQISNLILDKYENDEATLDDLDAVVDNVDDVNVCKELAFLCKYRDLRVAFEKMEELRVQSEIMQLEPTAESEEHLLGLRREGVEIVVGLLTTEFVPWRLRMSLLFDAMPLLKTGDQTLVISSQDTRQLMATLEEVALSHARDPNMAALSADQLSDIRQTLADCLRKAVAAEQAQQCEQA